MLYKPQETEQTRKNSQNKFGTSKTLTKHLKLSRKYFKNVNQIIILAKSVICVEKYIIICKKHLCSLTKRNEFASACRHAPKQI